LNEKLLAIDRRRIPPNFAPQTFLHQWSKQAISQNHPDSKDKTSVAIFVDTFTNYYEPQHAMAAAKFAERLGVRVLLPERVCCGRPLISKGFLHEARRQAAATTRILAPLAECSTPILFCEPGCYSAVRDDHPHLLRGELKAQAQKVADSCLTFEEWANSVLDKQEGSQFESRPGKVLLHTHCHQKALTGTGAAIKLLARIPGCEVIDLDSGCCGMAGAFGYEKNHYEISKTIAERKLLPAIRKMDSRSIVVAPGFSCRHQIKHFTGVEAHSPMTLLESLQR
jgi:Fe-S oxidoreductase